MTADGKNVPLTDNDIASFDVGAQIQFRLFEEQLRVAMRGRMNVVKKKKPMVIMTPPMMMSMSALQALSELHTYSLTQPAQKALVSGILTLTC